MIPVLNMNFVDFSNCWLTDSGFLSMFRNDDIMQGPIEELRTILVWFEPVDYNKVWQLNYCLIINFIDYSFRWVIFQPEHPSDFYLRSVLNYQTFGHHLVKHHSNFRGFWLWFSWQVLHMEIKYQKKKKISLFHKPSMINFRIARVRPKLS